MITGKRQRTQPSVAPRLPRARRHKQALPNPTPPDEDAGRKGHDTFEWVSVGLTAGGFVAAALAAAGAIWLAIDTDKLVTGSDQAVAVAQMASAKALKQAHSDSEAAVKEARGDANDALKLAGTTAATQERLTSASNSINREAFVQVQRAFLTVPELSVRLETGADPQRDGSKKLAKYWDFTPAIENGGNTPTVSMIYSAAGGINYFALDKYPISIGAHVTVIWPAWSGIRDAPPDPIGIGTRSETRMVLGPHGKLEIGKFGMTEEYIRDMQSRGQQMYIFGYVKYRDVFLGTPDHITKYCFVVSGMRDGEAGPQPSYGRCIHWNCSDAECKADAGEYAKEVKNPVAPRPPPIEVKRGVTAATTPG